MKKVLVTGANGQLGCCIKEAAKVHSEMEFLFVDKSTLDITNSLEVATFFANNTFDFCINAAAYTHVDKAENDKENAFLVNAEGVRNLSIACKKHDVCLLHISTDYVFDGNKRIPYVETDNTNPINVYGASKLMGESYIKEICERYYIIRTSWLYSQFGHNFYKSILKLAQEKDSLTITTEQTGNPTNANDLAEVLIQLLLSENKAYGVYHFSNTGGATWYDFAKAIITYSGLSEVVSIAETDYYPTFAKRPKYSILSNAKMEGLKIATIKPWQQSLKNLIDKKI